MGFSINRVTIVGKLGGDPETRSTTGGTDITTFNVATDHSYKDKDGKYQNTTNWHKILFFNLSDFHRQSLRKGVTVHLTGRIQTREYEDKEGVKKYVTEIVGQNSDLIVFGTNNRNGGSQSPDATQPQQAYQTTEADDDLPF